MLNFKVLLLDVRTPFGDSYPFWIEVSLLWQGARKIRDQRGDFKHQRCVAGVNHTVEVTTWSGPGVSTSQNETKWPQHIAFEVICLNQKRVLLVVIILCLQKTHSSLVIYLVHVWWTCAMDGACFGWVLLTLKRLKCPAVPLIEVQIRGYWSLSSDAGPNDFATFSNLTVNVRCVWGNIQCLVSCCSLSHICVHFRSLTCQATR